MGSSSFSKCLSSLDVELVHQLESLNRHNLSNAFSMYTSQIGVNVQRCEEETFFRIFSALYEEEDRDNVTSLYDAMIDGSGYSRMKRSDGIPILQIFAVLYLLCDPNNDSIDDKFDAIISICQFKYIPTTGSSSSYGEGSTYTNIPPPPNFNVNKSEFLLASECIALGLTRLLCRCDCMKAVVLREVADIVNDVYRSSTTGESMSLSLLHEKISGNAKINGFLSSFDRDNLFLQPLQNTINRNFTDKFISNIYENDNTIMKAVAPLKDRNDGRQSTSGRNVTKWKKSTILVEVPQKKLVDLTPKLCLSLIINSEHYCKSPVLVSSKTNNSTNTNIDTTNFQNGMEYNETEIEELEKILLNHAIESVTSADNAKYVISLGFFKMICISLLSYNTIFMASKKQVHLTCGLLCQNSLPYLQRLFNECAQKFGDYNDPPDCISRCQYEATKAIVRSQHDDSVSLYDMLTVTKVRSATVTSIDAVNSHQSSDVKGTYISASLLSRLDWVKYQCSQYIRHEQNEHFEIDVVNFFIKILKLEREKKNDATTINDGYISDSFIVYDFICYYLDKYNNKLFHSLDCAGLREAALMNNQHSSSDSIGEISVATSILRDHIIYLANWMRGLCEDDKVGICLTKVKTHSHEIKEAIIKFADYYSDCYQK